MGGTDKGWGMRVAIGLLWVLTVLEALGIGLAGFLKFATADTWTGMFAGWGYPAAFAYVIGCAEMAGAVGVLIPRFATYAAVFLTVIMLGALGTVIVHDDPLGVTAPIIHLIALAIIGIARRDRRWRPSAADG
jgi:putative oxidoreductase